MDKSSKIRSRGTNAPTSSSSSAPKHITSVLAEPATGLSALLDRCAQLRHLQTALEQQLPADLCPHVTLANIADGVVLLHADSSAWAARTRFMTARLLKFFQDSCGTAAVQALRIKVSLPAHRQAATGPTASGLCMADQEARHMQALALTLDDPALSAALIKLAQRGGAEPER